MVNLNKLNNAGVAFIQCGDFHAAQTTLNTALKGLRSSLKCHKHEYGSESIKILPTACEFDEQESLLQRFGSIFPFYPSPFVVSEGDSIKDETIEIGGDCVLMTVTIMFNFALVHHSAAIVAEREGKKKSDRNMLRALKLYQSAEKILNEGWDFNEHGSLLLALALANNIAFIQSYLGNLQEVNGSISWFEGMRAFSDQHSLLEFDEYMFFFSTGICFGGQPLALPAAA